MESDVYNKQDVWAFGITVNEIFTAAAMPYVETLPNGDRIDIFDKESVASGGLVPSRATYCPKILYVEVATNKKPRDTIESCFALNPKERPTFTELHHLLLSNKSKHSIAHVFGKTNPSANEPVQPTTSAPTIATTANASQPTTHVPTTPTSTIAAPTTTANASPRTTHEPTTPAPTTSAPTTTANASQPTTHAPTTPAPTTATHTTTACTTFYAPASRRL